MTTDQNEPAATLKGQRARLTVDFRPNTILVGTDYFARLIISIFFILNRIEFGVFIGLHAGLFLLEVYLSRYSEDELKKKILKELKPEYRQHVQDFVPVVTLPLLWLGLYMITGLLVVIIVFAKNFSDESTKWLELAGAVLLTIVGAYLSMLAAYMAGSILFDRKIRAYHLQLRDHPGPKPAYTDVSAAFPNAFHSLNDESMVAIDRLDANDGMIARLESDLKGINSKVDSYMLESVLLGALAFSGFLTIVASNVISGADGQFATIISQFLDSIWAILFSTQAIDTNVLSGLFKGTNLFVVIMFESLICSVFFIMVLTLRLRYSDMSLKMDYLIRVINIFNAKEEELIILKMDDKNQDNTRIADRTLLLTQKIEAGLSDASRLHSQIKPVVWMMSVYRNLGLIFF